jgi:hypothetical protein
VRCSTIRMSHSSINSGQFPSPRGRLPRREPARDRDHLPVPARLLQGSIVLRASAPHSALRRPPQPRKLLITEIRSLEVKNNRRRGDVVRVPLA